MTWDYINPPGAYGYFYRRFSPWTASVNLALVRFNEAGLQGNLYFLLKPKLYYQQFGRNQFLQVAGTGGAGL